MKLPSNPQKGRSVAADFERLLRWCKGNRIVNVVGGKLKHSASGTTIEIDGASPRRPGSGDLPPFWVSISFDIDSETYKLRVEPGLVRYHNINAEDSTDGATFHLVPKMGMTSIDESPAPSLTVDGELFVYVKVPTDDKGNPEGQTAEIELASTAQTSAHHVPPADGAAGISGEYYFLIAELEQSEDDPPVPTVKKRFTGNLHIPNQLIEIQNVGAPDSPPLDYGDVYAGFDQSGDYHKLRRIYGEGDVTVSTIGDYILISHCAPPSE